ncbi:MAG: TlpA disulfide reductase family protein [Mucilaginibacter sp.]
MIKKWLSVSNFLSVLLVGAVLLIALNHYSKSLILRGMMKVGFYQPKMPVALKTVDENASLSSLVFKSSSGQTINLADQKGKVVFIDFWATWCPYCIAELPAINELYLKLKADPRIVFIIADADHNFDKAGKFMVKHQYSLPVHSLIGALPPGISDGTIPLTLILDKSGRIAYKNIGTADYSNPKMLAYIDQLASAK